MIRHCLALTAAVLLTAPLHAQTIRNYDANFTTNTIVADGVISPGEWDGAASGGDAWNILREPFSALDQDGHRFEILWDDANLYILYQSNFSNFEETFLTGNPNIAFGKENINFYIDPNRDGDLNINPATGEIGDPNNDFLEADGYQLAFNQFLGTFISTGDDRQGIGFYTEAHVDNASGDQGNWRGPPGQKVPGNQGPGINNSGIVVGQTNSNTNGSIAELIIPFADLDADALMPVAPNADYNLDGVQDAADYTLWRDTLGDDVGGAGNGLLDGADGDDDGVVDADDYALWVSGYNPDGMAETGLNATDGVTAGEVWGFNAGFIGDAGANFLPVWNWHDNPQNPNDAFSRWPHGTLTFVGPTATAAAAAAPEPGTLVMAGLAILGFTASRRRDS